MSSIADILQISKFKNSLSVIRLANLKGKKVINQFSTNYEIVYDIANWKAYSVLLTEKHVIELECSNLEVELFFKLENNEYTLQTFAGKLPIMVDRNFLSPADISLENLHRCQEKADRWAQKFGIAKGSPYSTKMRGNAHPLLCSITVPGILLEDMPAYVLSVFLMMMFGNLTVIFNSK